MKSGTMSIFDTLARSHACNNLSNFFVQTLWLSLPVLEFGWNCQVSNSSSWLFLQRWSSWCGCYARLEKDTMWKKSMCLSSHRHVIVLREKRQRKGKFVAVSRFTLTFYTKRRSGYIYLQLRSPSDTTAFLGNGTWSSNHEHGIWNENECEKVIFANYYALLVLIKNIL